MATEIKTLYPTKIKTRTARSIQDNEQMLSNPDALKSGNENLAYWGSKTPSKEGSYSKNYPNSITSISGSYNKPAPFTAEFSLNGINNKNIIKSITVEYAWEQVSYSSIKAFGKFDNPNIVVKKGITSIGSVIGEAPPKVRYDDCKNKDCGNTNKATLKKGIYSHVIKDGVRGLTIGDLKNLSFIFTPKGNTSNNDVRIVMQYFRIKVEYTLQEKNTKETIKILPNFNIKTLSLNKSKVYINKEYTCKIAVENTNSDATIDDTVSIIIDTPPGTKIKESTTTNYGKQNFNIQDGMCIWNIKNFENPIEAEFICTTNTPNDSAEFIATCSYPKTSTKTKKTKIQILSDAFNFYFNSNLSKTKWESNESFNAVFEINMSTDSLISGTTITIDTNEFITNKNQWNANEIGYRLRYSENGKWIIDNIKTKNINFKSTEINITSKDVGDYTLTAICKHGSNKIERNINFSVYGRLLEKEYLKLRLEDGSDVQYNSLVITQGDDLQVPLTYTTQDLYKFLEDDTTVIGETKRISTKEAKYISFDVYVDSSQYVTYENVIAYVDVYNNLNDENTDDDEYIYENIIVGADSNVELFYGASRIYCIIKELDTNTHNKIKFIVQSDIPKEHDAIIKLKPLGYDRYDDAIWKPAKITFQDIPNIQIKIEGKSEVIYNDPNSEDAELQLGYTIQNKSNIKGTNLKFQLKEPLAYIKDYKPYEILSPNGYQEPIFDPNTRILHFPELDANSEKYTLKINYKAQKKGIHKFIIQTVDYENTTEDDQYINQYKHKVLTNITADLDIKAYVNNATPYVNDIIDYIIEVTNRSQREEQLLFVISDIGHYDEILHSKNDYEVIEWDGNGTFEINNEKNNIIGKWELTDVQEDEKNKLILSLKPTDNKTHVIKMIAGDRDNNIQRFDTPVQIFEPNKKIDFNVYHAINTTENKNCCNPDLLTEICDDDFITIDDDIYYVFEIINKDTKVIKDIKVRARIPKSFEYDKCYTQEYPPLIDNTGLIIFNIDSIKECSNKKFCIKLTPKQKGKFISTFILSAKNTKSIIKKLNLTVDSYFNERKIEHEITIYNFEKTNKYFRYELDGNNNLYKFYNKGDISKRTVDIEKYNANQIETYRGNTLKKLATDIKENSKYVEPELIRIGSNHLKTKGYELYPNGFINRFGLLNSEVFHYTGQLPRIGNLVDYVLKWDIDEWDQKLWTGDIYQNGVFDLTIDYGKIPTNFNILELEKPLNNLQALVDKVKPFGTKAICYFAFDTKLELKLAIELFKSQIMTDENFNLKLEDMGLISWYNRHDNTVLINYDLTKYYLSIKENNFKINSLYKDKNTKLPLQISEKIKRTNGNIIDEPIMEYYMDVFCQLRPRKRIKDCYDIVKNLQSTSNYIKNITISKTDIDRQNETIEEINNNTKLSIQDKDLCNFYFDYDIDYDEEIGIKLETENKINMICKYSKDKLLSDKFELINSNNEIINTINVEDVNNFKIQIQCFNIEDKNEKIIHFWCAINKHDYEYLGYYIIESSFSPSIVVFNKEDNENNRRYSYIYTSTNSNETISTPIIDNDETTNTLINNIDNDKVIAFSIDNNKKYLLPQYSKTYETKGKYQWQNLNKLGKEPVVIQSEKDTECKNETLSPPKIMLRYNKFNLDDTDEIEDIYFDIKSNKNMENINIGVFKDGDYYLPRNGIVQKTYFPYHIGNVVQEYNSTISVQQPNITICSNCLKTNLGYYDECPYCSSNLVTHEKEKQDVTICYNCGWIEDGWHNKCTHCLSKDIVKTLVDYNKTYCYNCQSMHDDYYNACPYCFSTNIVHLQNDSNAYKIYNEDITNINPIVIKSDIEKVNICNITIPLNRNSQSINELKKLSLIMNITNNNDGKYYYCENCKTGGLGNPDKCPYCNNDIADDYHLVNLYDNNGNKESNLIVDVYSSLNNIVKSCEIIPKNGNVDGTIDIEIPILDLIQKNNKDNFSINIYATNPIYNKKRNEIIHNLSNYGIEYVDEALKSTFMDICINNFYFKSEFINENKWNIGKIEGNNRDGIQYITNENETNFLSFHFNSDLKGTNKLLLYIKGINKSLAHTKANIKIISGNKTHTIQTFIKSNIFTIEEDIYKPPMTIDNIIVQINFNDVKIGSEIIITDCYLVAKKASNNIYVPQLNSQITVDNYNNKNYKITSENMWGIKEQEPQYLTGHMLKTGLLACFEFEDIDLGDILKIYDIKMIIVYKNKFGNIITDRLPITNTNLSTQMVQGNIIKNNSENWGTFTVSIDGLNNLESEIINTDDEKFLDSIPILNSVYQSFELQTNNIYKVILQYAGKIGYPDDNITVSIYDDLNGEADSCLASQKIKLPNIMQNIEIDFHVINLNNNEKYWIVIEDKNANEYNYHKLKHNSNREIGKLYIKDEKTSTVYDYMTLSFAIQNGYEIREFIDYPHSCELDTTINTDFKLYNAFYRFDTQNNSNVYLSNLAIRNGYRVYENDNIDPKMCSTDKIENIEDEEEISKEAISNTINTNNETINANDSLTPEPDCENENNKINYPKNS